jgi:hypothetical protein
VTKSKAKNDWVSEFEIQSFVDLDFVIGQKFGLPVGTTRASPPEFRRRILAALISYRLQLRSIDYALKQYVAVDQYSGDRSSLGDTVSDFLKDIAKTLKSELKNLHTQGDLTFGQLGAELTLFKLPETLDLARMLANRGLFLEVLPVLRLCLEMISWSLTAFYIEDEETVRKLKANACISKLKQVYETAGQIYGYFSKFSHWEHEIHSHFLKIEKGQVAVIQASCRYRAMSLDHMSA